MKKILFSLWCLFDLVIIYICIINLKNCLNYVSKSNILDLIYSTFALIVILNAQFCFIKKKQKINFAT